MRKEVLLRHAARLLDTSATAPLVSVIWGVPYLMIKFAVAEVSPAVLVFARTAVGAAVLLTLAVAGGELAKLR